MDTTLLQRSSWKNGGQAKQFGTDLWEWEGPVWSFLVRKLKSLGLTVDGISASFCGLRGFAAVCQRPFHRLHKWKRSLRLFLSMVYTTAQRDYAVSWCASSFPKSWLLFYLGFSGLLFRRRRTLTTAYHNPATKQCPVHVCQMYLPLSLSWSIFHEFCHFPDLVEFNQDNDFVLKSQSSWLFLAHFTDCKRKRENTQRLHACLIDQVVHFRKYLQLLSNRNCK